MSYQIKQDTNYSGDISTQFQGHSSLSNQTNDLQACSDLYREEKEIDVINYTRKGKYEGNIYKQLYYGKTISSFDALRPLFSSGFLNFICRASRNNKRFELLFWRE